MLKEKKIWLFANTKWFIFRFKFQLIANLSETNNIDCFYLRDGPPLNLEDFSSLSKKGINFYKINLKLLLNIILKRIFFKSKKLITPLEGPNLLIFFTFSQIILSFLFLKKYKKQSVYVLEGLGRIFSSKLIIFRFIKRIVLILYKYNFKNCKKLITLNYYDALFLSENKVASISKIDVIPGTGIDTIQLKDQFYSYCHEPEYIDYMSRLVVDKGYLKFIYTRLCFLNLNPELAKNHLFRIITPQEDINNFSKKEIEYFNKIGIILLPYKSNVSEYYSKSKIIIYPSFYGEGISRLVLEVSYLGIPLLVNRNRGIEEILPLNYKYYIKSMNPLSITNQLLEIIQDEEYFKNITPSQREKIDKNYSVKASLHSFLNILAH